MIKFLCDQLVCTLKTSTNYGKVENMIVNENGLTSAKEDFAPIGQKLLISVIVINLIVLISIFLCA